MNLSESMHNSHVYLPAPIRLFLLLLGCRPLPLANPCMDLRHTRWGSSDAKLGPLPLAPRQDESDLSSDPECTRILRQVARLFESSEQSRREAEGLRSALQGEREASERERSEQRHAVERERREWHARITTLWLQHRSRGVVRCVWGWFLANMV